jgi:hypothetical protein
MAQDAKPARALARLHSVKNRAPGELLPRLSSLRRPIVTTVLTPGPTMMSSGQDAQLKHNVGTKPLTWPTRRCSDLLSLVEFRLAPWGRRLVARTATARRATE